MNRGEEGDETTRPLLYGLDGGDDEALTLGSTSWDRPRRVRTLGELGTSPASDMVSTRQGIGPSSLLGFLRIPSVTEQDHYHTTIFYTHKSLCTVENI